MGYGANKVPLRLLTGAAAPLHFHIGSSEDPILVLLGKSIFACICKE